MSNIEVRLLGSFGSDRTIAESAWVSTGIDGNTRTDEQVENLIGRLATEGHGVPFESVIFRFYIKCPRYIETQILKHRISSVNGLSARYRQVPAEYYNPGEDLMLSHDHEAYFRICQEANEWYEKALAEIRIAKKAGLASDEDLKRAKEIFRGILPQAQMTELNMTVNLRSLANFIRLRNDVHAQKEIQEVAQKMMIEINKIVPMAYHALSEQNWRV